MARIHVRYTGHFPKVPQPVSACWYGFQNIGVNSICAARTAIRLT